MNVDVPQYYSARHLESVALAVEELSLANFHYVYIYDIDRPEVCWRAHSPLALSTDHLDSLAIHVLPNPSLYYYSFTLVLSCLGSLAFVKWVVMKALRNTQ